MIGNCEIHERIGFLPVCEHLQKDMIEDVNRNEVYSVAYYFGNFAGEPNCPMFMGFLYCPTCAEKYGLPHKVCNLPEEESDSAPWDEIKGVCEKCFDNFLAKHKIVWDGFDLPSE